MSLNIAEVQATIPKRPQAFNAAAKVSQQGRPTEGKILSSQNATKPLALSQNVRIQNIGHPKPFTPVSRAQRLVEQLAAKKD